MQRDGKRSQHSGRRMFGAPPQPDMCHSRADRRTRPAAACGGWRLLLLAAILSIPACTTAPERRNGSMAPARPLVIAHRGASALLPEHTLAAYAKAIDDGADFIEPDLVMTRDGVLVARHDNVLDDTTDVALHARFADRRGTRTIDGETLTGWFVEDFSLAELSTLRARERLPQLRSTASDGLHAIPTFDAIVALVEQASRGRDRPIGLIPELKHSSHHHAQGLDPEQALVEAIGRHAYLRHAPLGVQSFEIGNLERLRTMLAAHDHVFLVQLVGAPDEVPADRRLAGDMTRTYASMLTAAGLAAIATHADVLAPPARMVVPLDARGALAAPSGLVEAAHAAGLEVHAWTLRPENAFLPPALRCAGGDAVRCEAGAIAEARALAAAGVDAVFADDPGLALRAFRDGRD